MKSKKPDVFLGVTMALLVLAVLLCIVILNTQKNKNEKETTGKPQIENTESTQSTGGETIAPIHTDAPSTTETPVQPPQNLNPIQDAQLKADLDESLRGLTSEWQVMVIDPAFNTKVGSAVNCSVDGWMTANRMAQVFIMGTVFQQVEEGKLVLDDVIDDVKAMITANDTYAADRLTEKLGGEDASKGRENVKAFAVANGIQLGFNRSLSSASSGRNFVTAKDTAEILNLICSGKLVSEAASAQMLEILLTPGDKLEIDTGLPADKARWGFIADVEPNTCICAMGVVQVNGRNYVISVVCNEPVTTEGAKKKLTELIMLTVPYFES